jgi:glucose/arabinose dehydrogenase
MAVLVALFGLPFAAPAARALPPGYTLQLVQTGLAIPTTLRFAPDGRLFYTELYSGRIMVFSDPTAPQPAEWGTVPTAGDGEHGVVGLTFHPDYPDSPFVYVFHTGPTGIHNRIARLREQNGVGIGYTILVDSLFANSPGRFGGRMAFGPDRIPRPHRIHPMCWARSCGSASPGSPPRATRTGRTIRCARSACAIPSGCASIR